MARNNQRGSKNNNPEGRNQFTNSWRETARDRPVAAAAAAAAAVGAGVFLWSRRNQISDQITNLSDQFSDWTGSRQFSAGESADFEFESAGTTSGASGASGSSSGGGRRSGKSSGQVQGQAFAGASSGDGNIAS
jgi:hypothetical protein